MKVLDYFGLIGGFAGAIAMFVEGFGIYFSNSSLATTIASELYVKRRTEAERINRSKLSKKFSETTDDPDI